jgi:hypothetical protein
MATQDIVVEFGEGDAKKSLIDGFKEYLKAQPKQVDFAERGKGDEKDQKVPDAEDFTAIAKAAVEFQESEAAAGRIINSAQAVAHVTAQRG